MGTPYFNVAGRFVLLLALASPAVVTRAAAQSAAPAAPRASAGAAPARTLAPVNAKDGSAPWGPVQIVIYKSKRSMALYRFGNFDKEYLVVLGLSPEGRKRHANDARTPEGLYHIVSKRPHERWQYFLALDYPNARDRSAYEADLSAGKIPDEDGKPFAIGGSLGIHGNDRASEQEAGVDWTKGCIALKAADIAELASGVPIGTPVWIVE